MGNYLSDRRKALGLTQKEVAEMVEVSEATVSRWESGEIANMRRDRIASYAKALKVTPSFIMTGEEDNPDLPTEATPMNPQNVAPLLGTVRAGLPMYAEENIEDYIPIRQTDGSKYFWLNVRGDSMNAAGMDEGDQILVREQPEAENGQLAVVIVNGDEATVKYFRREGDLVVLTPKSFNPTHQPQIYDLKKVPVRIAGIVVECRKVFK